MAPELSQLSGGSMIIYVTLRNLDEP